MQTITFTQQSRFCPITVLSAHRYIMSLFRVVTVFAVICYSAVKCDSAIPYLYSEGQYRRLPTHSLCWEGNDMSIYDRITALWRVQE